MSIPDKIAAANKINDLLKGIVSQRRLAPEIPYYR